MRDPIESLLERTAQAVAQRQRLPEATYRLQFSAEFTFRDAERIVPYLAELGITHCYASPYLKARPGSRHGYDIVDHRQLNPELGSEEDFRAFVTALQQHGMGQILDVVPNHMGIVGNENAWWNDVLENGQASPFADHFDIDWAAPARPELFGCVLLPVLGEMYGQVLESQQLRLERDGGAFFVTYFQHRFPIAPRTYGLMLSRRLDELQKKLAPEDPALLEFQSILTAVKHLPGRDDSDPAQRAERLREKEVVKRRLGALLKENAVIREHLDGVLLELNGKPGDPRSFDLLDALLNLQPYRLAFWRVAADEINYRRFFDVNELAALSMEREEVFAAAHGLVLRLLVDGQVSGLRIDHVDGLYDPRQYLGRLQQQYLVARAKEVFDADPAFRDLAWESMRGPLRERLADALLEHRGPAGLPLYVIVEKILGSGEALPDDWPVYGTSGYEFLNQLNGLFVADTAREFTRLYANWIGDEVTVAEIAYREKRVVMQTALSSELHMLAYQLDRLAQKNRWSRDFTQHSLRTALREVIACFPVYRSYISGDQICDTDRKYLSRAIRAARQRNPAVSSALFQFVRDTILLKPPPHGLGDDEYRAEQLRFAGKFQQVTAPVMAKGIEDTAFYVFNRLLSLNEVGGDPARFGVSSVALHAFLGERQARWPRALSATATHDTKRGEDMRARLNVLSEIPGEWGAALARWSELNKPFRVAVEDGWAPDANEEYFLYQTLVGAWPVEDMVRVDDGQRPIDFMARIQRYVHKALHEAKVHSSWINPNPPYDEAMQRFVADVLNPEINRPFLDDLQVFVRRVSHFGLFNSLAQTLMKFTAPGVPDVYQGTELWDFSLVDPDNRRPVDFAGREKLLLELRGRADDGNLRELARELTAAKEDGRAKLYLSWRALRCRHDNPGIFLEGAYLPVESEGARREHLFSFIRRHDARVALIAVPRLLTRLIPNERRLPLGREIWGDTRLLLPEDLRARSWRNIMTGELLPAATGLSAANLFAHFAVALLLAET